MSQEQDNVLNLLLSKFQDVSFFCDCLRKTYKSCNKKILGIDYGTSKIGVALSDEGLEIAFPKDVLIGNWRNLNDVLNIINEQVVKYNVVALVIGFPRDLNCELHKNCEIIFEIAKYFFFEKKIPVLLVDERHTTRLANRIEIDEIKKSKKISRGKFVSDAKSDDAKSASIILQNALEKITLH